MGLTSKNTKHKLIKKNATIGREDSLETDSSCSISNQVENDKKFDTPPSQLGSQAGLDLPQQINSEIMLPPRRPQISIKNLSELINDNKEDIIKNGEISPY